MQIDIGLILILSYGENRHGNLCIILLCLIQIIHQKKIKEQLEAGQRETLKTPMINNNAVIDAVSSSKDTYIKLAKENKSFVIHEWDKDDRVRLFREAIKEYLVICTEQANEGFSIEDNG